MKSVALHNLGCKVNSYETEVMQQMLQEKGYRIVPFDDVADIYIVNTCTVTNIADRKSRQMLHRARQLNPDAIVVAAGCYAQTGHETILNDGSVDLVVGNNRKKDIAAVLEEYLCDRKRSHAILDMNRTYEYEEMQLKRASGHTRAYIKIQDGCNQFCSYCVIPYARGRVRSRSAKDIIREIKGLVETGYREVVLTGIHISSYGIDFSDGRYQEPGKWEKNSVEKSVGEESETGGKGLPTYTGSSRLVDLIEQIHEIPGLERIRIGSLEPRIITEAVAKRLAALPKLCPHFHLSLQSGCDATLKRMNRHYTTGEYYNSVEILRRFFERPAITTDVIVGFPGETEEEFRRTKEFLEKINLYEMHIFKYSRRAKTAAAAMPEQVPEQIKAGRSSVLLELERQQSKEFRRGYIGREAEVLLEEAKRLEGQVFLIGHTKDYVKVAVKEDGLEPGSIVKVTVSGFLTDEILM